MAQKQRMTPSQQKYAMQRVRELEDALLFRIKRAHTTPAKRLTNTEKLRLVKDGKAKMLPLDKISDTNNYFQLQDLFDFSKYASPEEYNDKAAEKQERPIRAKAKVVRDCIMLGDANMALTLLQSFEKECL
jgi:hypothetical protein